MTVLEQELPTDVRNLLDEHLDGLERVLFGAGVPRQQRHTICEDVKLQAREMLWQQTQDTPTAHQMRAVLAELDPPEAYLEAVDAASAAAVPRTKADTQPRTHTLALVSAIIPILAVAAIFTPLGRGGESQAIVLVTCAEVVAAILAVVALREIRRSPNRWTGAPLAVFGVLALPLILANFCAYMLLAPSYYDRITADAASAYRNQELRGQRISRLQFEIGALQTNPRTRAPFEEGELPEANARQIENAKKEIITLEQQIKDSDPTLYQRIVYENRKWIEAATHILVMAITLTGSWLLFVVALRRCQPSPRQSPT